MSLHRPVPCCLLHPAVPWCPVLGSPVSRAPVRARYAPSSPGRWGSSAIMPTSGNRPMAHSGMANRVLSAAGRALAQALCSTSWACLVLATRTKLDSLPHLQSPVTSSLQRSAPTKLPSTTGRCCSALPPSAQHTRPLTPWYSQTQMLAQH
jgi:hypothetical protein